MDNKPVYPKEDPEYKKRIMEQLYNRVRNTKWHDEEDVIKRSKVKMAVRPKSVYRPKKKYDFSKLSQIIDGRKITSV